MQTSDTFGCSTCIYESAPIRSGTCLPCRLTGTGRGTNWTGAIGHNGGPPLDEPVTLDPLRAAIPGGWHDMVLRVPPPQSTLGIPVVALSGPAGSGKSHAAQVLIDGLGYVKLPLAGPLKAMLRALPGLTSEHTDGALKEVPMADYFDLTPRRLMQTLGTEWGRGFNPEFWLQTWLRSATQVLQADSIHTPPGIVVDDVRFENEARFLQAKAGARVIYIDIEIERGPLASADRHHSSEREFGIVKRLANRVVENRKDGHEKFASAILAAALQP